MSFADVAGLFGVLLVLVAYAGAQLGRLEPRLAPALILNLAGAGLILWSLRFSFNMSAFLMEGTWALLALYGLIRLFIRTRARRPPSAGDHPASPSGR